ncbi:MAG: LysM peptidoglycan-binding domain-containing protein [Proteobacteria bacterium]|nr:LysM peptidoglycan-binding domain-containing protein [Pseudomonadota bacterium]MBI3499860.1 LysM peptidoglycan-binding domain-containing protein [Pseudomonadota bacterium]
MNRYWIIGGVGVLLALIAVGLNEFVSRQERVSEAAPRSQAIAPTPATQAQPLPAVAAPSSTPQPVAPSFDVVRVNPSGDAVIAGRGAPNTEVTVLDGDKPIGKVMADARGEWVLLPSQPLTPGTRSLSLSQRSADGSNQTSERVVVLVVPERQKDIAGRPSDQPSQALALSVPRQGTGPSQVLQAPQANAASPPRANIVPPAAVAPTSSAPAASTAPNVPTVTVDVVDYDDAGRISFAGKAESGAEVRVYLDNKLIGAATAGSGGDWRLSPSGEIAPGLYTLRADRVGGDGRVVARAELPLRRAAPLGDLTAANFIVIQPGNNLWSIARRVYGQGTQYTVIYQANQDQIRDPDLIYPGQVFQLPTAVN